MKVSIAGNDFSYHPEQEVDLDDSLAKTWIKVGHCEQLEGEKNEPKTRNSTNRGANKSK